MKINNMKFRLSLILMLMLVLLSTSIYAVSLPNTVLPYMSRGQNVIEVQEALNILGSSLHVDGIYGQATKNAVHNFQNKHSSLSNDGIYGPSTKSLLELALDDNTGGHVDPSGINLPNMVLPFMSRGDNVKQVQKALNYVGPSLAIDGVYGQATRDAMRNFQQGHGDLSDDGIYGPATKKVLEIALQGPNSGNENGNSSGIKLPNTVLPFMSRGDNVKQVQKALNKVGANLVIDGIYGQGTRDAMRNFQEDHGDLSNDGIYGPATKRVLEIALR